MRDTEVRRRRLEALFHEHAKAVHAYARRRTDAANAEDTVSEVFVIAWRRLEEVPESPRGWLLACARRVLANQQRGDRRVLALYRRLATSVAPVLPDGSGDGLLRQALNQLSERDREVLLLTAWEGLTPREAATVLECSPGALNVRVHRARKRLEAVLARLETNEMRAARMEAMS